MTLSDTMLDCLIVGGGIAGLSAGLALGRARRKTLICSDGLPRNAPARHSHNFLTRDGAFPLELQAIARQQLEPYTSVSILDFEAKCVERSPDGSFVALLGNDTRVMSRTVILATGVQDNLDAILGVRPLWGHSVFSCPFCHGWEHRDRAWAVLITGASDFLMVKSALSWTKNLLVCGNGTFVPDSQQMARLEALGISFVASPVVELQGRALELQALKFADGTSLSREALLYRPPHHQRSSIPVSLGCSTDASGYVETSVPFGQTSISGVFAAGDMTGPRHSVSTSCAAGTAAAWGVQHILAEQDFEGKKASSKI